MTNLRPLGTTVLKPDLSEEAAFFRALGDAHRLTIVARLVRARGPLSVRTLSDGMDINQSSVSHHLNVLCEAGALVGERTGTWVHYRIAPKMRAHLASALKTILGERWGPSEQS